MRGLAAIFTLGIFLNTALKATATNTCPQGLPEDPSIDILIPHESDCTKFYKCSHGEKIEQNCPVGLHFNAETNQCDWPDVAHCGNSTNRGNETSICPNLPEDPEQDILFPHESDCSKFYKCSHGQKVPQDCPEGLHFNPNTNQCDWPQNAKCEKNPNGGNGNNNGEDPNTACPLGDPLVDILMPHESNCTKYYQCDNGKKVLRDCPAGLHFNPKIDRCDWPENANCENNNPSKNNTNKCPADDPLVIILFPHESDCSKFYQCSNGEKILHNCSAGLHFNPSINQCDWPDNVICENSSNSEGNTGENTAIPENECPLEDPAEDILFPHEHNCAQFYKCSHGEKVLQDCPAGLHFNPSINQCDWPENVKCENNTNSDANTGENTTISENECPLEDAAEDILFPHDQNCTQFYKCSHGEKVLQDCPAGLHFNSKTDQCDWPENANCEHGRSNKNNTNECPANDPLVNIFIPHESDCSKFYQCSNGEKILHNCSVGLHFSPNTNQCDWPENVNCENNNSGANAGENTATLENECPLEDPSEDILFPHEHNCAQFYKCSHGEKVLQDCPLGLLFNSKIGQCDWPENVNCETTSNLGGSSNNTSNSSDKEPSECPSEDPEEDILYPHETNCSQFYKCSHGDKVLQNCPAGLHFNPTLKQCDWPESANCGSRIRYTPHEKDCTKFYQVVNNNRYEYVCANGLQFNPALQICDYKLNVRCQPTL